MINAFIKNQSLRVSQEKLVSDTIDYIEASFKFQTTDWKGLEKWAHFSQGDTMYDIKLENDGIGKEKHLNLTAGYWYLYLHGNTVEDGEVVQRITTEKVRIAVEQTGVLNGDPLPLVPPSVGEQLDARISKLEKGQGGGGSGGSGEDGEDGGYYIPSVSAEGVLSWSASKEDMPPIPSSVVKGDTGADGTSVTVKSVSESTADGGINVVTFSDGKTLTIKNGGKGSTGATGPAGPAGSPGANGTDGYTPVRGVDYWTAEDITEMESDTQAYIIEELAKRNQTTLEFVDSVDAMTDTNKLYVYDGFIYAYKEVTVEVPGAGYTNLLPSSVDTDGVTIYGGDYDGDGDNDGYKTATRLSGSSGNPSSSGAEMCASGFMPASDGAIVRIKGATPCKGTVSYVIAYDSAKTKINYGEVLQKGSDTDNDWALSAQRPDWWTIDGDGVLTITLKSATFGTGIAFIRFSAHMDGDTIITVNEEIKESSTTTTTETKWASTGHAFAPADYEDRIIALEEETAQNKADIAVLKKGAVDTGGVDALTWIRNWDTPIYDRVPVFQLSAENPAVTSADKTVASIYAKYDALAAANPNYITKTDLGVCSDGVTHVYRYDFCEPEPHHQSGMQWSETKPVVIAASGIHWEWGGVYSLYYALKAITENAELDDLRRNVHFVVVPIINPYCFTDIGSYSETYGVLNANGVQIHRNFEVGFIYPGQSGYQELGTRNHGGTEPLSEIETRNIDNIFKQYPDAALFLTCHSAQRDTQWGTGFIWASTATNYTCNLGFRLVDKMSKAWHKKYGTAWEEGCARENAFVLADPTAYPNAKAIADGDYRVGHAHVSATDGTETRQATKYGIQGANVEVLDTFWVLSSTGLDSKVTTHGAEVYINYLLMYMGCYDHKDKSLYAVGD